jgi:osmoprotectant transport system substrate-binding protein
VRGSDTGARTATRRGWLSFALAVVVTIGLATSACTRAGAEPSVVIGAGDTAEQQVLAAIAHESVRRAGVPVELREATGGTTAMRRQALAGQIDLYWDYTGAAWTLGMRESAPPADPLESWERVAQADEDRGLRWLSPSAANATLALVVRRGDLPAAGQPGGLGWLAGELSSGQRRLCADPEFIARADGLASLAAEYGIDTAGMPRRAADEEEAIAAVAAGDCFAGLATATSGAARVADVVPVADELGVFPAFVIAPVVRTGSPADREQVTEALARVTTALDTSTMARLNAQVAAGEDPAVVASAFVDGLAEPAPTPEG